eukprot:scaffold10265_cov58-Phaeocystis_antarctica.AAC.1
MEFMFEVRSAARVPCPQNPPCVPLVLPLPPSPASRPRTPRPASHAPLSTWQGASSLSDANKLLTRCAWAGTETFASAGYDESWAPGSCGA